MWGTFEGAMEKERIEAKRKGILEGERKGILEGERKGILEGERKGILEGKRKGILEGEQKGKKISAMNMLKRGFDYKTIAEISEVSVEQVKVWEKEL